MLGSGGGASIAPHLGCQDFSACLLGFDHLFDQSLRPKIRRSRFERRNFLGHGERYMRIIEAQQLAPNIRERSSWC
jgi:hypothetical protein